MRMLIDVTMLLLLLGLLGTYAAPGESGPTHDAGEDGHDEEVGTENKPAHHWSYVGHSGVDHWGDLYPSCGMKRQSPINFRPKQTKYQAELDHNIYLLHPPRQDDDRTIMVNNGHSVSVQVVQEVYAAGGGLGDSFKVAGFHFHWGSVNSKGSEHVVAGKAYPLEMHIVTYDTSRYANIGQAVTGNDSLAVLGVFFEVVKEDNPYLEEMIHHLPEVVEPDLTSPVSIPHMYLWQLLPSNTHHFYRYYGSLTTPGCFESVVWTVFTTPQTISQKQMNEFRKLHKSSDDPEFEHQYMVDNFRPPQPLNGRIVYRSYMDLPQQKTNVVAGKGALINMSTVTMVTALLMSFLVHW